MTGIETWDHPANKRIALPVIIAIHILLIYFWPVTKYPQHFANRSGSELILSLLFPEKQQLPVHQDIPKPETPSRAQEKPARQAAIASPTPLAEKPERPTVSSPESIQIAPEEPPTASQINTESLLDKARRDVGKIDRELRKEFPKFPDPPSNSIQAKLERGIAAAAVRRSGSTEEYVFADGRRVTRILLPGGGSYCVTAGSVGDTDGIDQMQRGVSKKVTSCGNMFK